MTARTTITIIITCMNVSKNMKHNYPEDDGEEEEEDNCDDKSNNYSVVLIMKVVIIIRIRLTPSIVVLKTTE